MKKVCVTSCSQSQGWPIVRVTISNITVVEKANSSTPQMIMRIISSTSSARHFRCRWRGSTSFSAMRIDDRDRDGGQEEAAQRSPSREQRLVNGDDQVLDLHRVWAQLLSELVQIRRGDLDETRFVDVGHDLHAKGLQFCGRF